MMRILHSVGLFCLLGCLFLGLGCSRKAEEKAAAEAAQADAMKNPAAGEVMAAIDKKDYDGAVGAVMKARQAVTNDEQQRQFLILMHEARQKLMEAAATDPKAGEALAVLRAMTIGR